MSRRPLRGCKNLWTAQIYDCAIYVSATPWCLIDHRAFIDSMHRKYNAWRIFANVGDMVPWISHHSVLLLCSRCSCQIRCATPGILTNVTPASVLTVILFNLIWSVNLGLQMNHVHNYLPPLFLIFFLPKAIPFYQFQECFGGFIFNLLILSIYKVISAWVLTDLWQCTLMTNIVYT